MPKRSGIPPLLDLPFSKLDDDVLLRPVEMAAWLRKSPQTLEWWRVNKPDHPLRWKNVGGWPRYRVGDGRAYIAAREASLRRRGNR
jgi:hypothetical protein